MDAKQAASLALEYVKDMFGDKLSHLSLEEIDHDPAGDVWLITVGFFHEWQIEEYRRKSSSPGTFRELVEGSRIFPPRTYKTVFIDGGQGEVLKIKNREVDAA